MLSVEVFQISVGQRNAIMYFHYVLLRLFYYVLLFFIFLYSVPFIYVSVRLVVPYVIFLLLQICCFFNVQFKRTCCAGFFLWIAMSNICWRHKRRSCHCSTAKTDKQPVIFSIGDSQLRPEVALSFKSLTWFMTYYDLFSLLCSWIVLHLYIFIFL